MQRSWYYDKVAAAALQLCHAFSAMQEAYHFPSWQHPPECPPGAKAMAGMMARTAS